MLRGIREIDVLAAGVAVFWVRGESPVDRQWKYDATFGVDDG